MRAIIVGLILLLPASAVAQDNDKKGKECAPVPEEFLSAGEVFRDCAVDKKARVTRHPRVNLSAVPISGAGGCMSATIELVVDEEGAVVPGTPRVAQSNSQVYAQELMAVIHQARYSPAKRGDVPVRQLDRYVGKAAYRVSSSADPSSRSRRPPPC